MTQAKQKRYVDLAALSLSGSLVPSVPTQLLVKYQPPKLALVYHFEGKEHDEYIHSIALDPKMLASQSPEECVSHLFMAEAYYFNPKQVKRS